MSTVNTQYQPTSLEKKSFFPPEFKSGIEQGAKSAFVFAEGYVFGHLFAAITPLAAGAFSAAIYTIYTITEPIFEKLLKKEHDPNKPAEDRSYLHHIASAVTGLTIGLTITRALVGGLSLYKIFLLGSIACASLVIFASLVLTYNVLTNRINS